MKYDFTSIIDRKGKDALAVDILPNMLGPGKKVEVREGLDYIPMWGFWSVLLIPEWTIFIRISGTRTAAVGFCDYGIRV